MGPEWGLKEEGFCENLHLISASSFSGAPEPNDWNFPAAQRNAKIDLMEHLVVPKSGITLSIQTMGDLNFPRCGRTPVALRH
jgi:hypothetical protein